MKLNKLLNKINIENVDDYIVYVLDNEHKSSSFKKEIINQIDKKIKHTLVKGSL